MIINEIFDSYLPIKRSPEWENKVEFNLKNVSNVNGFWTDELGPELVIFNYFFKDAYEYHFSTVQNGEFIERGKQRVFRGSEYQKIIATVASMIIDKISTKTSPVRILGDSPEMKKLYFGVLKHFAVKKNLKILVAPLETGFVAADGSVANHGFYLRRDTNVIRLSEDTRPRLHETNIKSLDQIKDPK